MKTLSRHIIGDVLRFTRRRCDSLLMTAIVEGPVKRSPEPGHEPGFVRGSNFTGINIWRDAMDMLGYEGEPNKTEEQADADFRVRVELAWTRAARLQERIDEDILRGRIAEGILEDARRALYNDVLAELTWALILREARR